MKYTPLELDNDKRIKTVYFPPNEGSEFIVKHSDQEGSIESRVGAKSTPHYIGAPYWELKPMTLITGQNGHSKTELLSHIRKAYRSESDELIFFLQSSAEFKGEYSTSIYKEVLDFDLNMKFLDTYHKFNQIRAQNPFRNGPHDEEVKWEERAKKDSGIDKFTQKQGLSKEFEEYISYNTASNINSYETKANVIKLYVYKFLEKQKTNDPFLYLELVLNFYRIYSNHLHNQQMNPDIGLITVGQDPRDIINNLLKDKMSDFQIAELTETYPNSDLYRCKIRKEGIEFSVDNLSSGESLIFQMLAIWPFSFFNPNNDFKKIKTRVMLLDEPDKHLDPNLCKLFMKTIRKEFVDNDIQVIMTTHDTNTIAFAKDSEIFTCKKNDQNKIDILQSSKGLATLRLTKNTREVNKLQARVYTEAIDDALFFENIYQKLKIYSSEINEEITQSSNQKTLHWSELVDIIGQQNWQTRILSYRIGMSFHSTSSAKDGNGGGASVVEANLKRDILTHREITTNQLRLFSLSTTEPFGIVDKDFGDHHFSSTDIQGFDSRFITLKRHSLENFIYDPLIMSSSLSDGFYTKIKPPMQAILLHLKNAIVNKNLQQIKALMKAFFMKICKNIIQYKIDSDSKFYKDVKLDQLEHVLTQKEIESLNKKKIFAKTIQLYDQQQKNLLLTEINKIINLQPTAIQTLLQSKIQEAQPYAQNLLQALNKVRDYNTGDHQISRIPVIFQRDIIEVVDYSLAFNNMQGHLIEDAFCHFFLQGTTKIKLKQEILDNMIKVHIPIPYDLAETFFELNAKLRWQMNSVIKPELISYTEDQLKLKGYYIPNNTPTSSNTGFYQEDYSKKIIVGSYAVKELIESALMIKYFLKEILHVNDIISDDIYNEYIKYIDNNYFFMFVHYIACNIGMYFITEKIDITSSTLSTTAYAGKLFAYEYLNQQKQLTIKNLTDASIHNSTEFIKKCGVDMVTPVLLSISSNVVNELLLGVPQTISFYDIPINAMIGGAQCFNSYNKANDKPFTPTEIIVPYFADIIMMLSILSYKPNFDFHGIENQMIAVKGSLMIINSIVVIDYISKIAIYSAPDEWKAYVDPFFNYIYNFFSTFPVDEQFSQMSGNMSINSTDEL